MTFRPAKIIIFVDGANVEIPFNVELHSGYETEEDLCEIARAIFPQLPAHRTYAEFIES